MPLHIRLSATVLALNEEARLPDCLASLGFCDEVLVVDGGSSDRTREIAKAAGARLLERPFDDFALQHEYARSQARGDWVLSLDADERASAELAGAARGLLDGEPDAYSLPFKNHYRGLWLKHGGFWPDRHVRLFRRQACRYDLSRPVHEKLLVKGETRRLETPVLHYTYESLAHCLDKSGRYAERAALASYQRGERAGAFDVAVRPLWRLLRAYLLKAGFLDGAAGAAMAWARAYEAYAKYARLWELTRFEGAKKDQLR